jgi:hypothetical protein
MILLITLVTLIFSACMGTGIYPRNKPVSDQSPNTKKEPVLQSKEVLEPVEHVD